jgi:hypothetical protein
VRQLHPERLADGPVRKPVSLSHEAGKDKMRRSAGEDRVSAASERIR